MWGGGVGQEIKHLSVSRLRLLLIVYAALGRSEVTADTSVSPLSHLLQPILLQQEQEQRQEEEEEAWGRASRWRGAELEKI